MKKILISIACMAIFIIGYYFISMKNMQDVTKMDSNLKEDAPEVEKELVISQGEDGFLLRLISSKSVIL